MGRRAGCLAIAGAALVVGFSSHAAANHVVVKDPNDTPGRLDVKKADAYGRERPRFKVVTYGDWSPAEVYTKGNIFVYLDSFGDERTDYYALVYADQDRKMHAKLWRDYEQKNDKVRATLDVWRKNNSSVSVRVPLSKLKFGDSATDYGWRVQTTFIKKKCSDDICFDFAPNNRSETIREPL